MSDPFLSWEQCDHGDPPKRIRLRNHCGQCRAEHKIEQLRLDIEKLKSQLVYSWYTETPPNLPTFHQGDEKLIELHELVTAKEVQGYVEKIADLDARLNDTRTKERAKIRELFDAIQENGKLRLALLAVKQRLHFVGMSKEPVWRTPDGDLIPDWRKEIALIEEALK